MPAILLRGAENAKVFSHGLENSGACTADRLHAFVVRDSAVDEIERFRPSTILENLDRTRLLELPGLHPIRALLLQLPIGISAAFEGLQRLLQRLRHVCVVDQPAAQVDNLVDVFDKQRAFLFASSAGCARPDLIFRVDRSDQRVVVAALSEHRIMPERVVPRFNCQKPRRERSARGMGWTVVRTTPAIRTRVEVEHVLPGKVLECLHAERLHLIELFLRNTPADWLHCSAIQFCKINTEQRRLDVELDPEWPVTEKEIKRQRMQNAAGEVDIPSRESWP